MTTTNQKWNVADYQEFASFVPQLGQPLLDLLKPVAGEEILDLGCGDGVLTEKLQEAGCDVFGIDSSYEMVEAAIVTMNVMVDDDSDMFADRIGLNMEAAKIPAFLFNCQGRTNQNIIISGGALEQMQVSSHRKPRIDNRMISSVPKKIAVNA